MDLSSLDPARLRALFPAFLAGYVGERSAASDARRLVATVMAAASDDSIRTTMASLAVLGSEIKLYEADPLARAVSRAWCRAVVQPAGLVGVENLEQAASGPTIVLCNHRSYVDTQATDALLAWGGRGDLADRLVTIAGPKVYSDTFRRFASLCLSTVPAPQSAQVAGPVDSPRELAQKASATLEVAEAALRAGRIVLIYPEGSRTRTGRLRPFLRGIQRYLECVPGIAVVPAAQIGTDRVFPLDSDKLVPAPVTLRFGPPMRVSDGRDALAAAFSAIGAMLPEESRPEADDPAVG